MFRLGYYLVIVVAVLFWHHPVASAQDGDETEVSYQQFYDQLSPYGQWIQDNEYGYVWVPGVDDGFMPYYTDGHWAMTPYGNTWVSDYPWGWACFHYGRWTYNGFYGWIWVPGTVWGPGWVAWRWGSGYCGWAPLYPGIAWGVSIYNCPADWWIGMPPKYLYRDRYRAHWRYGPRRTRKFMAGTTILTDAHVYNGGNYYSGPRRATVEQVTHKTVQVYQINGVRTPSGTRVSGNTITTYRPRVTEQAAGGQRAVPARVSPAPRRVEQPQEVSTRSRQVQTFSGTRSPDVRQSPAVTPAQPRQRSNVQPRQTQPRGTQPRSTQPVQPSRPRVQPSRAPGTVPRQQPVRPSQPQQRSPVKSGGDGRRR